MKETTCWKCDICGTEYKDKKKCEQCEDGHKKKGKIVKMRHLPYAKVTEDSCSRGYNKNLMRLVLETIS